MGGYDGHRRVMNYLAVHPKLQGRGYGKMLVEAIENKLIKSTPRIESLHWVYKVVSRIKKNMSTPL